LESQIIHLEQEAKYTTDVESTEEKMLDNCYDKKDIIEMPELKAIHKLKKYYTLDSIL